MIWHSFLDFSAVELIYTMWGICPLGINTLSCALVFYGADGLQGGLTANPWLLQTPEVSSEEASARIWILFWVLQKTQPATGIRLSRLVVSFARTQQKTPPHKLWPSLSPDEMFAAQSQFLVCIIAKSNSQESKDSALHLLARLGEVSAW